MSDYTIKSTTQAREYANQLSTDAQFYSELVSELENAKTQIKTNWEGDTQDINDIVMRIDSVSSVFSTKIIPSLNNLSNGIVSFADEIDATADNTLENGQTGNGGSGASSGTTGTDTGAADTKKEGSSNKKSEKKGFWQTHGENFSNQWDFSGCDSGLDYAAKAITATVELIPDATYFLADGAFELLDWLI